MKIYEVKQNATFDDQPSSTKVDVAFINEKKGQSTMTTNEILLIEENEDTDYKRRYHWVASPSIFTEHDNHHETNYGVEEKVFDDNIESQQFYHKQPVGWCMIFRSGLTPFNVKRWPVVTTYILLTLMFVILSGELLLNQEISNEFIELDPLNLMIGPSIQVLIQSGARFPPCIRTTRDIPPNQRYVCLHTIHSSLANGTNIEQHVRSPPSTTLELLHPIFNTSDLAIQKVSCTLQDICGMTEFTSPMVPDQSFRFFTPLFVHSGVIHYLINVFLHWFLAMNLERVMNPIRFAAVYILSGIFGTIFGANFSSTTHPFMGSNPSLFGLFACSFIDIIFMWRLIGQPKRHLIKITTFVALSFSLGMIPGVDYLAQLGGLIGGFLIGIIAMPAVYYSKKYQVIIWICRIISMAIYTAMMVFLVRNFYQMDSSR